MFARAGATSRQPLALRSGLRELALAITGYAAAYIHDAKALEFGEHIEADPVKATAFWKQACKLGDDSGCDGFARLRANTR